MPEDTIANEPVFRSTTGRLQEEPSGSTPIVPDLIGTWEAVALIARTFVGTTDPRPRATVEELLAWLDDEDFEPDAAERIRSEAWRS